MFKKNDFRFDNLPQGKRLLDRVVNELTCQVMCSNDDTLALKLSKSGGNIDLKERYQAVSVSL